MGKGYEERSLRQRPSGTDPFESSEESIRQSLRPQDVPTFEDANSVHLLGNMKEGGLNNPPLSPRLCVTTHPAPVLKFWRGLTRNWPPPKSPAYAPLRLATS